MKGAVLYGPRDIRFVERKDPKIVKPTDIIIRLSATSVCGSDLRHQDAAAALIQSPR